MHITLYKGFTLVETLVAVSILIFAIIGPMTLASQGIQTVSFAREQVTATFLAQEALESIQNLRDDRALFMEYGGGGGYWAWYGALPAACKNNDGCDIDVNTGLYHPCSVASDCLLKKNGTPLSNGDIVYGYGTGAQWLDSRYTRKVYLTQPQANKEVTVTVVVSWLSSFGDNVNVTLQTRVFNQYR